MSTAFDFGGRVVLVTGGSRGIGKGIAAAFTEAGAEVAICGRTPPETEPPVFFEADVRDAEQVTAMIDRVVARFDRLDVLVNNAGGAPHADAATASPRFSKKIIQLNLLGPLHCAQAANTVMQKQQTGGVIINVASVSAVRPSPGSAAYGAAKAGLVALTTSLAVEWAPKVRLNAITAGMIATETAEQTYGSAESMAKIADTVPLKRLGTPSDIAKACLYLASDMSSYVSGASLLVHGGGEWPAFLEASRGA